ncbi:hypothetical protein J6590_016466 [Homalodisca vitripennis]|nr:hypothetical protein J6590_016466 [Homalodisca vitripennis]
MIRGSQCCEGSVTTISCYRRSSHAANVSVNPSARLSPTHYRFHSSGWRLGRAVRQKPFHLDCTGTGAGECTYGFSLGVLLKE